MDVLSEILECQKRQTIKENNKHKNEMGIKAKPTEKSKPFYGKDGANSLFHALVYLEDYWNYIVTNLTDDIDFIDRHVSIGINQIISLLDYYKNNQNRFIPLDDIKFAIAKITGYKRTSFDVITENDVTKFIYTINTDDVDNNRRNKLADSLNRLCKIDRTENGIHIKTIFDQTKMPFLIVTFEIKAV